MVCGWSWRLKELDESSARLVMRTQIDYNPSPAHQLMYRAFVEPGSFIMERRMMLGVKERVEAL